MLLTENDSKWASIIKEELGVENAQRVEWMSKYAQIHEIHEAQQNPGAQVSNGLFSTPLNTVGMGNPMMPQGTGFAQNTGIGNTGADFHNANYVNGSGDIPMSTLPIAMTIAAQTIGFDLVPVVPAAGPYAMLQYFDTPYAGGKMGLINETSLDGRGVEGENKPIYIKIKSNDLAALKKAKEEWEDNKKTAANDNKKLVVEVKAGNFVGELLGFSRIDAGILVKVAGISNNGNTAKVTVVNGKVKYEGGTADQSIADVFASDVTISFVAATGSDGVVNITDLAAGKYMPELVDGNSDHVQEFQNFATETSNDLNDTMTRAENETGTGNTVGARMFSKMVQMGSYEVTGSVTRQQLQDMPLYGIDVVGKILEQMQNRISQAINNRILDRLFKLGCTNHAIQNAYQKVNLNLSLDAANIGTAAKTSSKMVGIDNVAINMDIYAPADINNDGQSIITYQRRISSRMLAAANIIANVSRRGRGNFVVTNTKVLTALQDAAGFIIAPMVNNLTQDGSQSLYFAGSIAGLNLYVDPNMAWDDTRILVGKKGNGEEPGVIFMPYILADTVQTIVEGTMAPKMLMNSRFAIVDAGFYPEQSYLTFEILDPKNVLY